MHQRPRPPRHRIRRGTRGHPPRGHPQHTRTAFDGQGDHRGLSRGACTSGFRRWEKRVRDRREVVGVADRLTPKQGAGGWGGG